MTLLLLTYILTTGLLILTALRFFQHRSQVFDVPTVGLDGSSPSTLKLRFVQEADVLLREGYKKFNNCIFQVLTPDGPRLFLPRRYAIDLKPYKRHQASGMKALADRLLGQYTTIDHESAVMLGAIKIDLNRHLGNFVGTVQREVAWCFENKFPSCSDWTSVELQERLNRVVAQASASIFVGPRLCRNEDWLNISVRFAMDIMAGYAKLKLWHPWLRPVARYLVPEVRRIQSNYALAHDLLLPELRRRATDQEMRTTEINYDAIEWMQQRALKIGEKSFDTEELAKLQMLTATAAIHTTTLALTHILLDLSARPEYLDLLREEIKLVMGDGTELLQKQHLTQLKKLDSFMKESMRLNPPSLATFQRKALVPIKLSDGFVIPPGIVAQCNTHILDEWPQALGSASPHDFDGLRFYNLRQDPDNANKFQFANTTYDSMQFGFGNDACPGRFYASNEIKIILVHILRNYDIRLDEGATRPKNILFEVNVLADPSVPIWFRKRG